MKQLVFTSIFLIVTAVASARTVYINTTIMDNEGCLWHVQGTVDISVQFDWPPVKVNSYNISMSGPCGQHSFSGLVAPSTSDDGMQLYNFDIVTYETKRVKLDEAPAVKDVINFLEKNYATVQSNKYQD